MKQFKQESKKTMVFPSYNSQTKIKKTQYALYSILCKKSYLALAEQAKVNVFLQKNNQEQQEGNRVMGTVQNKHKLNQLWSLNQSDKKSIKKQYQIINIHNNMALNVKGEKVYLAKPELKKQQLFTIQAKSSNLTQLKGNPVFIRSNTNGYHLSLFGILKLSQPNQHDQTQQFIINLIDIFQSKPLRQTVILSDPISKYCLDSGQNQKVFLKKVSNSLSQRWKITPNLVSDQKILRMSLQEEKEGRLYQISNFQTKKSLIIKDKQKKYEIIQEFQSNKANQWYISCDNFMAIIKSKTTNKFLGVVSKELQLTTEIFRWGIQCRKQQN